ncbi:DNA translocase FtsK [Alkaliphilus pronyensis]|uniref:DNA translocase FtsK n=1 Tax=Alkaliphilus pronyensis TaxID=1482732 RepID=A0A6I0F545_9FIRM|nr:DNA translocase FtsK [Alkaliphilus pronyensis]KAB3536955.1 DNA translocase FtsK [Alkaliphilus pronyensis]
MSRRTKRKKSDEVGYLSRFNHEIKGVFLIAIGLILVVSMHTTGAGSVGEFIKDISTGLFSTAAYILSYIIILCGVLVLSNAFFWKNKSSILYFSLVFISLLIIVSLRDIKLIIEGAAGESINNTLALSFRLGKEGIGGGLIGNMITGLLVKLFGEIGGIIIVISILIISTMMYTKISLLTLLSNVKNLFLKLFKGSREFIGEFVMVSSNKKSNKFDDGLDDLDDIKLEVAVGKDLDEKEEKIKVLDFTTEAIKEAEEELKDKSIDDIKSKNSINGMEEELQLDVSNYSDTQIEYILPNIGLLNQLDQQASKDDKKKIIKKAKVLEETLKNFGVDAKVIQVSKGPVITRYELQPSIGVKVSKIVNLSDDIALNMAAPAIRIEAPIPGKAAIGIEIPNDDAANVTLREVIDSNNYKSNKFNIPFALGKDISGNPVVTDISKMPHLLVAGATGSGKSVCINSLILSILFNSKPEDVRLILIDPKVVELNQYNGIPHLLIPVVTDPKKATSALNWAVQEMTKRYKLFADGHVKDIKSYNEKYLEHKLPFIVIIIDELADLMMVAANDVEDAICRLAQMARAAGLHLILATQRPSVDVITGVIKANIPSRIAFSTASQADSRTILDMGGAEKLLGKGDMLFYPIGANKPIRLQGAFVSEAEVERVIAFIKNQIEKPLYESEIISKIDQGNTLDMNGSDELFDNAVELVLENQQASISMLQRRLRIGYNRAARLIDEMEEKGIIGQHEGSKPRQVLIKGEDLIGK